MKFRVYTVDWETARAELAAIRRRVFIEEQCVPEALEWDGLDENALHVIAHDDSGAAIGCARLLSGGRIGRMAVLPEYRGGGVGRALLQALLQQVRAQGLAQATLSAQTHAIPFYAQSGFEVCSEIYDDAGIPHRDMRLALSA